MSTQALKSYILEKLSTILRHLPDSDPDYLSHISTIIDDLQREILTLNEDELNKESVKQYIISKLEFIRDQLPDELKERIDNLQGDIYEYNQNSINLKDISSSISEKDIQ